MSVLKALNCAQQRLHQCVDPQTGSEKMCIDQISDWRLKTSPGASSDFLPWSSEQLNIDDFKLVWMHDIKNYQSINAYIAE